MRTLSKVLSDTTAAFPERHAIIDENGSLTYEQLNERVDRLARGLIELGVGKGEKVGLWMPNISQWVIGYFAVARIGAVVVPMNTRYKPHEVRYILENSEATTLFMVDTFAGIDYLPMVDEVRSKLPNLKHAIVVGKKGRDMHTFDEVEALGALHLNDGKITEREAMCNPQDNMFILYTSGTTGNPKGAMLSHHNIAENGKQVTEVLHATEEDTFLLAVPFFHCFGCVMGITGAVTWGASIVPMTIFKAKEALELVEKHKVSVLYGVPTMFVLELEEYRKGKDDGSTYDVSSLRTGIMAGAPCPVEVMRGVMEELHCNVSIAYGLTEASPVITMTRFDDSIERRVETVGRALPGIEVKIADEDRRPVAANEMGELACRGYNVMMGYYKMPDKTAEAIDEEGWLYSGDLATMDAEGYVKIVGRKKDMLITGGFNVYPAEIEEYLFTHPKVQNVSVVGVADDVMGEVAVAYIIPKEGATIDPQEIVDYCTGEIANFKVPRYVAIVDEFPMTQSGKIQKFRLRELTKELLDAGKLTKLKASKK
jgi:fatty-acyl-CoA synthase